MAVSRNQRHTRSNRCPICGGADQDPRGKEKRCNGFTSADGRWVRCSREEHAGALSPDDEGLFRHMFGGTCNCGTTHTESTRVSETSGGIEAVYDYVDERGARLFQVVRFYGKKIRQRRPGGVGEDEWVWNLAGVRRVLYRLPDLLEAPADAVVYFAEGEKDVDALRERGLVATCNPHGAGKWKIVAVHARDVLRGRRVVVIADKDEAGRKHADEVARALGASVLELPDGDRPVKDAFDFFAAGATAEQLRALDAKLPAPPSPPPAAAPIALVDAHPLAPSWRDQLLWRKKRGGGRELHAHVSNVSTILANDEEWSGVLGYDEFGETIVSRKVPPWRPGDAAPRTDPGEWSEEDTGRLQGWLATKYDLFASFETAMAGVKLASRRAPFHPVREWLSSLRWDGQKRAPTWLVDVVGAPDTPLVRAISVAWLVACVARAFDPGCKLDTVLVLEGAPGIFKSSVLRALAGDAWFLEMNVADVASKDAMQVLRRKWIAEFPEFDSLARADQAKVKAYFTTRVDTYRASYGRGSKDYPRQTAFAATTNKSEYVLDETGGTGRRLWPIACSRGDVRLAAAIRDQLWAEARARYESSEEWHFTDPELRDAAAREQDMRRRVDPWEQAISKWLAKPNDLGPPKHERGVTTAEVLSGACQLDVARHDVAAAMRAGSILRLLGWHTGEKEPREGARVRVYRPKPWLGAGGDPAPAPVVNGVAHLPEPTPLDLPFDLDASAFGDEG